MKKTRLSVLCGMCLALGLSSGAAEDPSVLFRADYDTYSPAATLRELWNDWPVEASKIGDVEIPAGRFVLIGIR